jgi:hypothetical protein
VTFSPANTHSHAFCPLILQPVSSGATAELARTVSISTSYVDKDAQPRPGSADLALHTRGIDRREHGVEVARLRIVGCPWIGAQTAHRQAVT